MDCYRQRGGDNGSDPSKSKLVSYSERREIINIRSFFLPFRSDMKFSAGIRFFPRYAGTTRYNPVFKPVRNKHISVPSQAPVRNIPAIPAGTVRVKAVASGIGVPTITIKAVSPVTRSPTLVDKMVPSVARPPKPVTMQCLLPLNHQHWSPMRHLLPSNHQHRSLEWRHWTLDH